MPSSCPSGTFVRPPVSPPRSPLGTLSGFLRWHVRIGGQRYPRQNSRLVVLKAPRKSDIKALPWWPPSGAWSGPAWPRTRTSMCTRYMYIYMCVLLFAVSRVSYEDLSSILWGGVWLCLIYIYRYIHTHTYTYMCFRGLSSILWGSHQYLMRRSHLFFYVCINKAIVYSCIRVFFLLLCLEYPMRTSQLSHEAGQLFF